MAPCTAVAVTKASLGRTVRSVSAPGQDLNLDLFDSEPWGNKMLTSDAPFPPALLASSKSDPII